MPIATFARVLFDQDIIYSTLFVAQIRAELAKIVSIFISKFKFAKY